ncbi:globin domain-containing protein [Paenibacillus tarimensis]|uniref:globin domain-containing protein n=1 Tax=Paenibacillus tarimensis TaxID=416012 RepID=UPI001F1CB5A1|nr:globin [Paenibacillus tarimensis]MCF2943529.1 globin [Paenibacillus tarimensis]
MSAYHTLFDAIGGEPAVRSIVEAFYPKVQEHELLSPLFPEDITPVMEKQFLFLTQFFGGPQLYSDRYGHPMMRARHMPFPIDKQRAEAWLDCMRRALQETDIPPDLQIMLLERLSGPAHHFINTDEPEEA